MKNIFRNILILSLLLPSLSFAADEAMEPRHMNWPFEGPLGAFDRQSAQRGFKVFMEVCSACHSLKHLYYRNLKDLGFSDAEIKELASRYNVVDGPNDEGEMFERPAVPSDAFVTPYPNEQAARSANGGANPVDLSLIVKARHDGANYLYSLLTGYRDEAPEGFNLTEGLYYNDYFPGNQIAMPPPLNSIDQVEYPDGTKATIDQMARDVTIFLHWASEPEMEHRKSLGLKVFMFLFAFTILFYIAKNRTWANVR